MGSDRIRTAKIAKDVVMHCNGALVERIECIEFFRALRDDTTSVRIGRKA